MYREVKYPVYVTQKGLNGSNWDMTVVMATTLEIYQARF